MFSRPEDVRFGEISRNVTVQGIGQKPRSEAAYFILQGYTVLDADGRKITVTPASPNGTRRLTHGQDPLSALNRSIPQSSNYRAQRRNDNLDRDGRERTARELTDYERESERHAHECDGMKNDTEECEHPVHLNADPFSPPQAHRSNHPNDRAISPRGHGQRNGGQTMNGGNNTPYRGLGHGLERAGRGER
ncbi:hypothetical protein M8818_007749 [Zalaria obscura]|uniref:Uncharacterized protein n=1 Tax=Zalaria obscura TaxID=2024903 RepID=A0ACC3S2W8_9PEZI